MADDTPDIAAVSEKSTTGELDPSLWDEAAAVTGRPVDEPEPNSTFADRAKARTKSAKPDTAEADEPAPPAKKAASRKRKN